LFQVPDRGGRANEYAVPPPEMPSWQQKRSTGGDRGGRVSRQKHAYRKQK